MASDNDAGTDWVTVKVPKETRDRARDDDRTYQQIMEDGLETPDVLERLADLRARVDELETRLPSRVADELEGRR